MKHSLSLGRYLRGLLGRARSKLRWPPVTMADVKKLARASARQSPFLVMGLAAVLPAVLLVPASLRQSEKTVTDLDCLTEAIYFEARGEPWNGQLAVANVVLNRVNHPKFPQSVCDVVRQEHQFSYYWDGLPKVIRDAKAWHTAGQVARMAMEGFVLDDIENATFYHATHVRPKWSASFKPTAQIGRHIFYKM